MGFGPSPDSWVVRSLKGTHWTTAIAQNAIDIENVTPATGIPTPHLIITRVSIWADQNHIWDISFWKNDASQPTADHDTHGLVSVVNFAIADGFKFGGVGPFLYTKGGTPATLPVSIRYPTDDGQILVGVTSRTAGGKNAGATGEIVIELSGPVL